MDRPPGWLSQVIVGFLLLNLGGFGAVVMLASGTLCAGAGTGASSYEEYDPAFCDPAFYESAYVVAVGGGLLGASLVLFGVLRHRKGRRADDGAPTRS